MHSDKKVEYMAFPRAIAIAELNWTPKSMKNFDSFWHRPLQEYRIQNTEYGIRNHCCPVKNKKEDEIEINLAFR